MGKTFYKIIGKGVKSIFTLLQSVVQYNGLPNSL